MGTVWRSDLGVSEKSEVGHFLVDALGHFYCVANTGICPKWTFGCVALIVCKGRPAEVDRTSGLRVELTLEDHGCEGLTGASWPQATRLEVVQKAENR